jgi:hypothetical protein
MKFRLRKTCTRGRKGDVVEVDLNDARMLAANGIIDIDAPAIDPMPELTKIAEPEIRKRGRPPKVRDASHA